MRFINKTYLYILIADIVFSVVEFFFNPKPIIPKVSCIVIYIVALVWRLKKPAEQDLLWANQSDVENYQNSFGIIDLLVTVAMVYTLFV